MDSQMSDKKWKMFERIVAAIHVAEQKGATVLWNEKINGRQFDVTVRYKHGLYEYLTVVECKDYSKSVPAEKIDALVTKSRDAHADKAIMVSASGFQNGAVEVAKKHGIQLFSLRTLSNASEGTVTDALLPILWVYDFRFQVAGKNEELAIPEEPAVLRMFLRDQKIEGPSVDTIPERILDDIRSEITRLATAKTQKFVVPFPNETVVIHPNLGTRTPITSFSVLYQLITASDLKTTEGLGVDPYFDGSIYKLENELTKESLVIDSSKLKLGFNTILEPGKYYRNPHLGFSYYCLEVKESKADMILIESYQNGVLFQATLHGSPKDWWWQFIEVTDKKEIERLTKLHDSYAKNTSVETAQEQ
jgi:hypothetical protein